jgi:hypothetical protein
MQTTIDMFARDRQEMAEQAAAGERAQARNVETFTGMWLTLGADVITAAGSCHQEELAEALGIASHRWDQLLHMEAKSSAKRQVEGGRYVHPGVTHWPSP